MVFHNVIVYGFRELSGKPQTFLDAILNAMGIAQLICQVRSLDLHVYDTVSVYGCVHQFYEFELSKDGPEDHVKDVTFLVGDVISNPSRPCLLHQIFVLLK